jgi:hypothetical protein
MVLVLVILVLERDHTQRTQRKPGEIAEKRGRREQRDL